MKLKDFIIILVCILLIVHICFTKTKKDYEAKQLEENKPAPVEKVKQKISVQPRKEVKKLELSVDDYNNAVNNYNIKMQECTGYLRENKFAPARECFEFLSDNYYDYEFYQENINAHTYNKALIDRNLGNYEKAKKEFEEVIYYEKNNETMIRDAKILLDEINESIKYEAEKKTHN